MVRNFLFSEVKVNFLCFTIKYFKTFTLGTHLSRSRSYSIIHVTCFYFFYKVFYLSHYFFILSLSISLFLYIYLFYRKFRIIQSKLFSWCLNGYLFTGVGATQVHKLFTSEIKKNKKNTIYTSILIIENTLSTCSCLWRTILKSFT